MRAVTDWARILAYVAGTLDQELLARNEHLAAENRILINESYFASVEQPLRAHLMDASRDYAAHDYQRMIADVVADESNDPNVLLVRGTAMVRSSDHDTFIQGLELLTAAGKLGEAKAIGILGVLRLVGFVGYPQDIPRGRALLQRSAELGDTSAWASSPDGWEPSIQIKQCVICEPHRIAATPRPRSSSQRSCPRGSVWRRINPKLTSSC